ncbi:MAG: hypothetical protein NTZ44_00295 [Candidatus Nomurabacteria bacterium]|nr:hypothetical protein [Candidatus Nomurabacteria bacterium]
MINIFDKFNNEKVLKWIKILMFIGLSFFLLALITYKIPLPAAEDLPRQMANGRDILQGDFRSLTQNVYSFTDPTHYFANHHWLFGVLAYISYMAIGWSGMVIFKIILILGTFFLMFKTALKKANFWLVAACSIPYIILLGARGGLRPELFGYFFIALYLYIITSLEDNKKNNIIYWLIPLQILWANLHITFPIGIMLVGGFLMEKIILNYKNIWQNKLIQKLALISFLLIAVSFINPNGIKGVIYSLEANTVNGGSVVSAEVQPLFAIDNDIPKQPTDVAHIFLYLFVITTISFIVSYKSKRVFYFLAVFGTALLTFKIIRSFTFFAMIFLLVVPENFNIVFLKIREYFLSKLGLLKIKFEIFLSIIFIIIFIFVSNFFYKKGIENMQPGLGLTKTAEDSARFFIDNNLKGPILNDTDIGSYLIWYLYPKEKVFADNRFGDAYNEFFWKNEYQASFSSETKWKEVDKKYIFNTIFINQYDRGIGLRDFIFNRIHDPEWVFVYGDDYNVILVKNTLENKEIIDKYKITVDNSYERFSNLVNSENSKDQVTAADLFGLIGQVFYTQSSFARGLAINPNMPKVWFAMGKTELERSDVENSNPSLALLFLNQAISRGWNSANAYSFLALAYYRLGFIDKAKEAVAQEFKMNPKSEDVKVWMKNFIKYDAEHLK